MANITLPTTGSGTATPVVTTLVVTADSSNVQVVALGSVAAGVLTLASAATPLPVTTAPTVSAALPVGFTSTTSAVIFSANTAAKLRTFSNDSNADLYLMMRAATASIAAGGYHVRVASGAFFATDYLGEVRGILNTAITVGQVNVGEFT